MRYPLLATLIAIGTFQGIFTALIFISLPGQKKRPNRYLAMFFLALSASAVSTLLIDFDEIGLIRFFTSLFFLFGPILYAYTQSSIDPESSQRKSMLLHSGPALIAFGFYGVQTVFVITGKKESLLDLPDWIGLGFWLAILIHFSVYILACVGRIREWNSVHDKDTKYVWNRAWFRFLFILLLGLMFVTISMTLFDLAAFLFDFPRIISSEYVIVLTAAVMLCSISFYSVRSLILRVTGVKKMRVQGCSTDKSDAERLEKVKAVMRSRKLYRDPDLSLPALAKVTGLTRGDLSRAINTVANENFSDFVHRFRLEEVKARLLDPACADKNILDIAFDCGFNSKSSFNIVFKRYTGKTPREFQRQR